jgi:hypothetical protein
MLEPSADAELPAILMASNEEWVVPASLNGQPIPTPLAVRPTERRFGNQEDYNTTQTTFARGSKPNARRDSRHPRNIRRCGNNRQDNAAALNAGSESARVRYTDGRRGDTVAYQFATHDIRAIGRRLGCLTTFVIAASLDHNSCPAPGASSSSGYDVSRYRRQCRALRKKKHSGFGQPALFIQGLLKSDGRQLSCRRNGWRGHEKKGTKRERQHGELQCGCCLLLALR